MVWKGREGKEVNFWLDKLERERTMERVKGGFLVRLDLVLFIFFIYSFSSFVFIRTELGGV